MRPFKLFIFSLTIIVFQSCVPLKNSLYLQETNIPASAFKDTLSDQYLIRPNDNLYIQVIAADDQQLSAFLNITGSANSYTTDATLELASYIVSSEGKIDFPTIGEVPVQGLTIQQVKQKLQTEVNKYINNTSVIVKLINRNFTVLGEVNKPGEYKMVKNKVSIFEALGCAGDMTDFGNRKKVKLIRETPTGKKMATFDITDKRIIDSPYYNVLPNDVIYIEPINKTYGVRTLSIATILTALSTGLLIYNSFKK
ncbi:MAG: polysaccharide biosynthesis/export family protein [Bacteroidota bacterium]|nr:polysaccharide biosynthesis/export family protein [Bacteroidota bacterium]